MMDSSSFPSSTFVVRVLSLHYEGEAIISLVLGSAELELSLPPVEAGAHVDLHLANGLMRSYSLSNCTEGDTVYRLTVARDAASRGGSDFVHDQIRVGQTLTISAPRNNFPLCEDAPLSIFLAGGIGITPFLPMMSRLNTLKRPWQLVYGVRTRARAALLQDVRMLAGQGAGAVQTVIADEDGTSALPFADIFGTAPEQAHVYCCGPSPMLDAFRAAAAEAGIPDERVHFEYFSGAADVASEGGYRIVLQRSNLAIEVQENETILEAVRKAGVTVPFSCEQGVCGACETRVLCGQVDHRDLILSDAERAAGDTMMICCSGSLTQELVLDL